MVHLKSSTLSFSSAPQVTTRLTLRVSSKLCEQGARHIASIDITVAERRRINLIKFASERHASIGTYMMLMLSCGDYDFNALTITEVTDTQVNFLWDAACVISSMGQRPMADWLPMAIAGRSDKSFSLRRGLIEPTRNSTDEERATVVKGNIIRSLDGVPTLDVSSPRVSRCYGVIEVMANQF